MAYAMRYSGDPKKDDPKKKKKEEEEAAKAAALVRAMGDKRQIDQSAQNKYDIPDVGSLKGSMKPAVVSGLGTFGPDPGSVIDNEGNIVPYGEVAYVENYDRKTGKARNTSVGYDSPTNADWWKKGDPIFAGEGSDYNGWSEKYSKFFEDRIMANFTPEDKKNLEYISKHYLNPNMTDEENYQFHARDYARRKKGGYPEYNRWLDYSGIMSREEQAQQDQSEESSSSDMDQSSKSETPQISEEQQMRNDINDAREKDAAKRDEAYKKFMQTPEGKAQAARVAEYRKKEAMKNARKQDFTPTAPADRMKAKRYNDNFSRPGGPKNKASGPRVVRRKIRN